MIAARIRANILFIWGTVLSCMEFSTLNVHNRIILLCILYVLFGCLSIFFVPKSGL